jgi:eukaryotic-like serine/threonine-protein kinase
VLGRGGQKCVYLVRDTVLDRPCALSVVDGEAASPEEMERVRREARALARMGAHPNIVAVYDLGEEQNRPFIVSELVAAGDLAAELEKHGPLPPARVIALARDLLRALDAVHRRGVVHRDIKPSNIWLAEDGTPKLGDFGLAIGLEARPITETGTLNLTPTYAAPELLERKDVDGRTDLYELGCTLYELLTGRPPFIGSVTSVITQHLYATPSDPCRGDPEIPAGLGRYALRLLAKSPGDRPVSAAAALEELSRIDAPESDARADVVRDREPLEARAHTSARVSVVIPSTPLFVTADERRRRDQSRSAGDRCCARAHSKRR